MSTRYQPQHPSGNVGPCFDSATAAGLWIFLNAAESGWTVEPVAPEPTLQQIDDAITEALVTS